MREFNIGTIVPFGGYDWRILDIKDNTALIITEYMTEQQQTKINIRGVLVVVVDSVVRA
jgi:hypothetical protein